jgi:predicted transcriptional regulator
MMDEEPLDGEVKTRISLSQKRRLQEIARERHLKVADIIREAIREKLEEAVPA